MYRAAQMQSVMSKSMMSIHVSSLSNVSHLQNGHRAILWPSDFVNVYLSTLHERTPKIAFSVAQGVASSVPVAFLA